MKNHLTQSRQDAKKNYFIIIAICEASRITIA